MRATIGISVAIVLILAGLSVREWLIQEEIQSLRVELRDQIQDGIRQTQSLERLSEFKKVQSINERYLEPVVLAASRQLIPGNAQRDILSWRRDLNTLLSDQLYLRELTLTDKLVRDLDNLRVSEKPGLSRIQTVLSMTEALDSTIERTKYVKAEIDAIQAATKKADQETLDKLKVVGKNSLSLLRKKSKSLQGSALANYLTSLRYENEVEQPVLSLVFTIKHPGLRQKAWDEFNTARRKLFGERFKSLAKSAESESSSTAAIGGGQPTGATMAEVLKREYQREMNREKFLQTPADQPIVNNPNDSRPMHDPELLELGGQ